MNSRWLGDSKLRAFAHRPDHATMASTIFPGLLRFLGIVVDPFITSDASGRCPSNERQRQETVPGNGSAVASRISLGLIQVMKTLFLIRHAKSSWDDTALPDKHRPLGDRGRRDAPKMGKRLAKRDVKPDLILSSPARRALTTAEIIAKKLDYKLKDIVVDDRLYASAVHSLLNVIHGLGDKPERVMLFGHNPELTEFAHRLSGEITHMPTCAVAEFTFSAKLWRNIGKPNLARVALDYPKKKKS